MAVRRRLTGCSRRSSGMEMARLRGDRPCGKPRGADAVPAWDMGFHGAFVPGADMMFKMGAEMLHHDAVQPVVNG